MANLGLNIEIYENNALATGYQVGLVVRANSNASPPREQTAYLATTAGAVVNFDSGRTPVTAFIDSINDGFRHTMFFVQPPDRHPMTLTASGTDLSCDYPFFGNFQFSQSRLPMDWGPVTNPTGWAYASVPYTDPLTTDDLVRMWFVKVQLKVRWNSEDGAHPDLYPLQERAVGGGNEEWAGVFGGQGYGGAILRNQSWYIDGQDPYSATFRPPDWQVRDQHYYQWSPEDPANAYDHGYVPWGYTDTNGIVTYRFLAAWAIGKSNGAGGYDWTLFRPGTSDYGEVQNISFFTAARGFLARNGLNFWYGWDPYYPWFTLDEDHVYRQRQHTADVDDGHNWRVDYTTWNAATGTLTTPAVSMPIHSYRQAIKLRVLDSNGDPIQGVSVTYGSTGEFSGSTDENGEATVYGVPRGSTLATILPWLKWGEPSTLDMYGKFSNSAPVSNMPLQDASIFSGESIAYLKPSTWGAHYGVTYPILVPNDNAPADTEAYVIKPRTTATFQVVGSALDDVDWAFSATYLNGGEVVTLPWEITLTKDATTLTLSRCVWEDCINDIGDITLTVDNTDSDVLPMDMDVAQWLDEKEPYLTDCRMAFAQTWVPVDLERSWGKGGYLLRAGRITCPSRVLLPDHSHLLMGVQNEQVKLWAADIDRWDRYSAEPLVVAADTPYAGVVQRLSWEGSVVYAWATATDGTVKSLVSLDGTWSLPQPVSSLPTCKPQRIDVRTDGMEWMAVCPEASGKIQLYRSTNAEDWTLDSEIAATGDYPWFVITPIETLLCIWYDGTGISARTGVWNGTAYAWESPVTVAASAPEGGAVCFCTHTKAVVAVRRDRESLSFYRSFDFGTTWEEGSYG